MYIEIHNGIELEQKVLYFKLQNSFNMDSEIELNKKIAGIYAIYKNDICLYVGQSKNIASRLATHIKGKYEACSDIFIWDIENLGFDDFLARGTKTQSNILLNAEKYLMTKLKPIENLLIDMNFKLSENETPDFEDFIHYAYNYVSEEDAPVEIPKGYCSNIVLKIEKENIIIFDTDDSLRNKKGGIESNRVLFAPLEDIEKEDIVKLHKFICDLENSYYIALFPSEDI